MNLAESLLAACERHPELEAFPGIPYGDLLPRVRTIAGGLASAPGERVALVLDNRLETALLYWACQWAGAVAVPLSWRLSEDELAYCIEDCGAAVVIREDDPLPDGPAHPGELDRDEREISLLLYTSGTTGRPKGVPRSHAADRAGAWSQALQHGYAWRDRTLGVMPLYHTMGIHSLLAMHLVGGCFVPQPRWDAGEALRLDRGAADHVPVPRADALPRPRPPPGRSRGGRLLGARARLRRRSDDVDPRPALRRRLPAGGLRQPLRLDRDLHVHDRTRPGRRSRGAPAARLSTRGSGSTRAARSSCISARTRRSRRYWNRPDADAKAMRDGWYRTGDTGHLDEDGDLWLDGRVDDMIVSGGENIHPLEVEDVLAAHPASTRSR